jgi:hypothetical protein
MVDLPPPVGPQTPTRMPGLIVRLISRKTGAAGS